MTDKQAIRIVHRPPGLRGVKVTTRDERRLLPYMGNWVRCHRYLMRLPPDSAEEVAKMLLLELNGKCRLNMLDRLASRYNHIRAVSFHNEVTALLSEV